MKLPLISPSPHSILAQGTIPFTRFLSSLHLMCDTAFHGFATLCVKVLPSLQLCDHNVDQKTGRTLTHKAAKPCNPNHTSEYLHLWRERKKPTRCNNQMFIINFCLNMFQHHYAHLQENKDHVTAYSVLRWFCWMWLVAVVGRCVVGCEHCEGYSARVLQCRGPQPLPTTSSRTSQYTICSNMVFDLLKMGIMLPETCWDRSW